MIIIIYVPPERAGHRFFFYGPVPILFHCYKLKKNSRCECPAAGRHRLFVTDPRPITMRVCPGKITNEQKPNCLSPFYLEKSLGKKQCSSIAFCYSFDDHRLVVNTTNSALAPVQSKRPSRI